MTLRLSGPQSENQSKQNEDLDFARELRKLWNMNVLPIVITALRTVQKVLARELQELEIEGGAEIIQTKVLLRSTIILIKVLETWEDLLSLRHLRKTTS